jgi:hypothetical protein
VHGHNHQTSFTLVDSPQQSIPNGLEALIHDALAPHIFTLRLEDLANAS